VEADEELAQRLQAEEREKYIEAEQARLLTELINQRKRYFAEQRAEERRNKPPTQAQQRTYMYIYIKNMGSYTPKQLRSYSFDEIKTLFETTMREIKTFVPIESEVDRTVPEESSESRDKEVDEELQQMMIIVPEQGMNVEALQTKDDLVMLWKKGIDIYMLVEKEYPLSMGTLTLMLVAKLLVEQDNEMSKELLRKIFLEAERPRR
ncbi:hypothetical protein Tco_1097894, partial [Tanacetum coccineum]